MKDSDLDEYCKRATAGRTTHAEHIHPSNIVTAAWVRWKSQLGCPQYGKGYCCPPDTPTKRDGIF